MSHLLIDPGVVLFKGPTAPKHVAPSRWWAERGLVCWEDSATGQFGSMTVRDALIRVRSLSEMLGNSRSDRGISDHPDEVQTIRTYIDQMIELCKKAQQQGMPDDPNHSKQLVESIKAKRQSRLLITPNRNSRF